MIENADQTSQETSSNLLKRYERLLEISRHLNSTLDIDLLLRTIVEEAAAMTGSEAASILLIDSVSGALRFEAAIDPHGFSLESIEVPMEGSIAGWVVENGESLIIEDASTDPRFFKGVDEAAEFKTRNLLAVPMLARDKVIGCLEALNTKDGEAYSPEDLQTLNTLAAQAAVAIANARLFEQSDLIAEMVHELRTPLAAIKATTFILDRPDLPPEKHSTMVQTLAAETQRLTRLTTEFLELTRLESGRSRIRLEDVDLEQLIPEIVETVAPQASDKNVTVSVNRTGADLPLVKADETKLTQVMLNLLTNAIKYNREGGTVTVHLWLEDKENKIYVAVEDTGLGISEENLPHVFEKFYRVADTEGYTQGTGLGLAIAKRIVEGHGGSMTVESEAGAGTTFTFTIPTSSGTS